MQSPLLLNEYFSVARRYYEQALQFVQLYWKGLVVGLIGVGGIALCSLPYPRHFLHQGWGKVRANLMVDSAPASLTLSVAEQENKIKSLSELTSQLEEQLGVQDRQVQALAAAQQGTIDQFKAAQAELAKSNDLLQKQQKEWLAALQKARLETSTGIVATEGTSSPSSAQADGKININTASVGELDALPGIGPTYAQRIVDYREKNGAFKQIDDLDNVSGIGSATIDKLRDKIKI